MEDPIGMHELADTADRHVRFLSRAVTGFTTASDAIAVHRGVAGGYRAEVVTLLPRHVRSVAIPQPRVVTGFTLGDRKRRHLLVQILGLAV